MKCKFHEESICIEVVLVARFVHCIADSVPASDILMLSSPGLSYVSCVVR